ncbi:MAG TPA: GNAT family N-acetyltransferase [Methanocella sp.]|jgi:phosphinothricin acetyltransferase
MEITIEKMSPQDRDEIESIFRKGVQSGDLVLDTDDPATRDIAAGRNLVARAKGQVIGWAMLDVTGSKLPSGLATVSVFVSPDYRKIGVGRALLNAAVDVAASNGISKVITSIVPKNVPALLLHKSCGFKAVGMLQKAGVAKGQWQDAVLLRRNC